MVGHPSPGWLLCSGGLAVFTCVKGLYNRKVYYGFRGSIRQYRAQDYPITFWSDVIILATVGLWNIGFGLTGVSNWWLIGFGALMALAMTIEPVAKQLDEGGPAAFTARGRRTVERTLIRSLLGKLKLDDRPLRGLLIRQGADPHKPMGPQVALLMAQATILFGAMVIAIFMLDHYLPIVTTRTLAAAGFGGIGLGALASLLIFPQRKMPPGLPLPLGIMFRLFVGMSITCGTLGIGGIANGYGTPIVVRDVPVVAKYHSLQSDPAQRSYTALGRVWPGSREVSDVGVPLAVYDSLAVPISGIHPSFTKLAAMPDRARIRLLVGKGRFGLDWVFAVCSEGNAVFGLQSNSTPSKSFEKISPEFIRSACHTANTQNSW